MDRDEEEDGEPIFIYEAKEFNASLASTLARSAVSRMVSDIDAATHAESLVAADEKQKALDAESERVYLEQCNAEPEWKVAIRERKLREEEAARLDKEEKKKARALQRKRKKQHLEQLQQQQQKDSKKANKHNKNNSDPKIVYTKIAQEKSATVACSTNANPSNKMKPCLNISDQTSATRVNVTDKRRRVDL